MAIALCAAAPARGANPSPNPAPNPGPNRLPLRGSLRKWGFRRCEDISWIKSNRETGRNHHWLPNSVLTATTEHCLVGIRGTVRRNYDGNIIHANVDTDVMLSEEP